MVEDVFAVVEDQQRRPGQATIDSVDRRPRLELHRQGRRHRGGHRVADTHRGQLHQPHPAGELVGRSTSRSRSPCASCPPRPTRSASPAAAATAPPPGGAARPDHPRTPSSAGAGCPPRRSVRNGGVASRSTPSARPRSTSTGSLTPRRACSPSSTQVTPSARSRHQSCGDRRHQDLPAPRHRHDPRRPVHRRTEEPVLTLVGLAGMQAHPHRASTRRPATPRPAAPLGLHRGADGVTRAGERRRQPITPGREHVAVVASIAACNNRRGEPSPRPSPPETASHNPVEPTTSVNKNVTVPCGRPITLSVWHDYGRDFCWRGDDSDVSVRHYGAERRFLPLPTPVERRLTLAVLVSAEHKLVIDAVSSRGSGDDCHPGDLVNGVPRLSVAANFPRILATRAGTRQSPSGQSTAREQVERHITTPAITPCRRL